MSEESRLAVLIVGAGIAGLATGLALRAFADVTILESASELKPIGAAVTLGPGVVTILRRWGIHLEHSGGVVTEAFDIWSGVDGNLEASRPYNARQRAGDDLIAVHRVDLHKALLEAATGAEGPGHPCKLILGQKVAHVDTNAGSVRTTDEKEYSADVLIGADGIRSAVRPFVTGSSVPPSPSGESAYRAYVPVEAMRELGHPLIAGGALAPHTSGIMGGTRRIIAYPVRGGTLLNLVCYVPDVQLSEATSERWTAPGDTDALLDAFASFAQPWRDMLAAARDVGIWQLRDMDPLETWAKGRTLIIGDAAHPMLPHRAGGALSAIEDAEAVGVFLARTDRMSVPAALRRVFCTRASRTREFQEKSRADGLRSRDTLQGARGGDLFEMWMYPGVERWVEEHPEMVLSDDEGKHGYERTRRAAYPARL